MARAKKPKIRCQPDMHVFIVEWLTGGKELAGCEYRTLRGDKLDFVSQHATAINTARGQNVFSEPTPTEARRIAKELSGKFPAATTLCLFGAGRVGREG